jgi:hypothetical protein
MSPEPLTRPQRLTVLSIAVLVGLTRFIPLSLGPWDWDEVLFCLAIGDYDVGLHQPHPAGFPLFVVLGKLARYFTSSDFHALQAVNVAASILVFPTLFWLARAFRLDFLGSLAAGLIFSFLTNVWFYGGTAFSDPVGMVAFLAAMAAYLTAGTSTRRYLMASILLAAGVLVRPQNAVVAVFPWTIATVRLLRARRVRTAIAGSLVLVLLVGIGYAAAAYATGVEGYVNSLRGHSQYVTRADSIASVHRPPLWEVLLMQLDPFEAGKVALLINILALIGIIGGRRHVTAEVLLTFVPFFLFSALAANPLGTSRFSLNYLAGVVILAVEGTNVLARLAQWVSSSVPRVPRSSSGDTDTAEELRGTDPRNPRSSVIRIAILATVVVVLVGRLIVWGLPAFEVPRTTVAPPSAAAIWLGQHVPVTSTLFVQDDMIPWAKYFAPRHRRVVVSTTHQVLSHPAALTGWYIAMGPPPSEGAIGFLRPRNRTWNIVTQRAFETFVQPTREVIGFGQGWYNVEDDGSRTWRWSMKRAVMLLGPTSDMRELHLKFHVAVDVHKHPVRVTFTLNGTPLGSVIGKEDNEVRYLVRGRPNGVNTLVVEVSETFIPARSGPSTDQRELGIMLHSWSWRSAATAAPRRKAA